ncbi:MAG: hypothetical protein JKY37_32695 [Nannocystaceae bacterium]|nr:hypothetical protein [Nannocystaceae bacterium]
MERSEPAVNAALERTTAEVPSAAVSLAEEQAATLQAPRRRYGLLARILFITMDVVYGRKRTLSKFKVLEVVARVPYQAWEHVAYIALTHKYRTPAFARRIFGFIEESRRQQDNEQWHLLILQELIQARRISEGFLRFRVFPQILAMTYYQISWLLYVIRPALSYELNADFEDHAEHEYMAFVQANPAFDDEPWTSAFEDKYGSYGSLGDVLRQIGVDERHHKEESIARIPKPRFG